MNERSLPPHLKTLDDIEKTSSPGLMEVLREESVDAVRHVKWEMTSWHRVMYGSVRHRLVVLAFSNSFTETV
jgi:hypothetical protein